jgi:drug/metabolite transporter (DMT)-like permease
MTPAVPLASAVAWGVADFNGGLATRSVPATRVAAMTQTWGLLLLVPAALLVGGTLPVRDALFGLLAGVAGALGLVAYFEALARGPMGVASPLAGVIGVLIPVVVGLGGGERPSVTGAAGIGVAVVAVLLAGGSGPAGSRSAARGGILLAAASGIGFGLFFVLLHATSSHDGVWPLVTARVGSLALLWTLSRRTRGTVVPGRVQILVATSGLFDMAANMLYLVAVHHGLLSVTAVTVSLYPVVVLVLARVLLGERLTRHHRLAAALALAAAVLISL